MYHSVVQIATRIQGRVWIGKFAALKEKKGGLVCGIYSSEPAREGIGVYIGFVSF
jgi:hypothetical protein